MLSPFLDTSFLIALVSKRDNCHEEAKSIYEQLEQMRSVLPYTSKFVMLEYLGFFSKWGLRWRKDASSAVRSLLGNSGIRFVNFGDAEFDAALELYEKRVDKRFSLVDCHIICTVQKFNLAGVISFDSDFDQEGVFLINASSKLDGLS